MTTETALAGLRTLPNDPDLLARVLTPYRDNCQYLKSAEVVLGGSEEGVARALCEFEIEESCYIDSTGHFNAVEFNICYNQMFYYIAAKAVQDGLFAPFDRWSMQDYWDRQLPDILIAKLASSYRRGIHTSRFQGEITLEKVVERAPSADRGGMVVVNTGCRFWDQAGGDSRGEVKIVITNAPANGG
ncbi:FcoT family thioesterase [Streptomyces sp. NPDC093065]|uniref:FcoT family thioesterase n=1 Tax=Streptomyces sp. NPDC093065 TaxID=3366021 RepID=UPI003817B6D0